MAGPRQPEEMVLIIFASSLPSRLLPQCCAGISMAVNRPFPRTKTTHCKAGRGWRHFRRLDYIQRRLLTWKGSHPGVLQEYSVKSAALCVRVTNSVSDTFLDIADFKVRAVMSILRCIEKKTGSHNIFKRREFRMNPEKTCPMFHNKPNSDLDHELMCRGQTAGSYLQGEPLQVCSVTVMPIIHLAATSSSFTDILTNAVSRQPNLRGKEGRKKK